MESVSTADRFAVKNHNLIQLYSAATPNGMKVAACLEELVDLRSHKEDFIYEAVRNGTLARIYSPLSQFIFSFFTRTFFPVQHSVNLRESETRVGPYKKIAPHGKIPALIDPQGPSGKSITLWESGACLQYLAEKHHELIPCDDPANRVECLKWLFWGSAAVSSQFKLFGFYYRYCPQNIPYCIARYTKEVHRLLAVLDEQLGTHGNHWVIGGEFSVQILHWLYCSIGNKLLITIDIHCKHAYHLSSITDIYTIADISIWPWVHALHVNYGDAISVRRSGEL
jgi:GSH-dependent disulfide-bond oxidoreductase